VSSDTVSCLRRPNSATTPWGGGGGATKNKNFVWPFPIKKAVGGGGGGGGGLLCGAAFIC
jgi:hypothetical protein